MVAFFPWLKLNNELDLGSVRLINFERGKLPGPSGSEIQIYCDQILQSYESSNDKPVTEATLMILKDKQILEDFTDTERNFMFFAMQIIIFSGLSKREFFSHSSPYCNRDDFTFIIQRFEKNQNQKLTGIGITERRRDGGKSIGFSASSFKVACPFHLNTHSKIEVDESLATALLTAQDKLTKEKWIYYSDAISNFNRANTDSSQIHEQEEAVMLLGSLQRILEVEYKRDETVEKFLSVFKPKSDIDLKTSKRIRQIADIGSAKTLREVWVKDFCNLRNDFGHGKNKPLPTLIWESHEHLLIASYLIPLVVKLKLQQDDFYKITNDDNLDIKIFEKLLDSKPFDYDPNDESRDTSEWYKIRNDAKVDLLLNILEI